MRSMWDSLEDGSETAVIEKCSGFCGCWGSAVQLCQIAEVTVLVANFPFGQGLIHDACVNLTALYSLRL